MTLVKPARDRVDGALKLAALGALSRRGCVLVAFALLAIQCSETMVF
jgi:hypothetical protein